MLKKVLFLAAAMLLLLYCAQSFAETTTVMVYMCGSNLETLYGAGTKDIQEMMLSRLDASQTRVFVMAGGSQEWKHEKIKENQGGLYTLAKKKKDATLNMKALDSAISGVNMGDGETLAYFLNYCWEASETDRYALILWDHGGGPMNGVCWDEIHSADHLTMNEIISALASSPFKENPLEWIGFDACLMGSAEVASKLSPFAKYMISSQAEEPACGWNYAFLKDIENDSTGADTGKRIIDAYFAVPQKTKSDLTLSCVDLSRMKEIEASMDAMYGQMASQINEKTFSAIAKLRIKATGFGKNLGETKGSNSYDLVDIVSLSESYAEKNPAAAEAVKASVSQAVLYNRSNVPDSCGLSVYHPYRNQDKFISEWKNTYEKLDFCPGYTFYVNSYGEIMTGKHLMRWNDLTNISTSEDGKEVRLDITPEQAKDLASVKLVVLGLNLYDGLDDAFYRVYTTNDVKIDGTHLSAAYDGRTLQIQSESGFGTIYRPISYQTTEDGVYLVNLYPYDENKKRLETPIVAEYLLDESGRLILKGYVVYDEMMDSYTHRADVDLSQYTGITFQNEYRNPTKNEYGETIRFDDWTQDDHKDTQWKARRDISRTSFALGFIPDTAMEENLYAGFEITDTQGNQYMSDLTWVGGGARLFHIENYLDDNTTFMLNADIYTYWEDRKVDIWLDLGNSTEKEQTYVISDVLINGVAVEKVSRILDKYVECDGKYTIERASSLLPGEMGSVALTIRSEDLECLQIGDTIERLSGTLWMIPIDYQENKDIDQVQRIGFALTPNLSSDVFFHREDEPGQDEIIAELPCEYPAIFDDPLILNEGYAIMRPSDYAANSSLLINTTWTNILDEDMQFAFHDVKINGVAIGRRRSIGFSETIAPGETGVINFELKYEDIAAIMPDVELETVAFKLFFTRVTSEKKSYMYDIPIKFFMHIPLESFCPDTTILPSKSIVNKDKADGNHNVSSPLLAAEDCAIYLQNVYIVGKKPVLLFKCENKSDQMCQVYFGQAEINGQKAQIGNSFPVAVSRRNQRNRFYAIQKAPWETDSSGYINLNANETRYCYVSFNPDESYNEINSMAFSGYMKFNQNSNAAYYFDNIEMRFQEPLSISDKMEMSMNIGYTETKEGIPVERDISGTVLNSTVLAPSSEEPMEIPLRFDAPEGETMKAGFYMLMRRVRSDAELAEMNIPNEQKSNSYLSAISFEDDREWMMFEGSGKMTISDDERSGSAMYPCVRPVIRAGEESLPLTVYDIMSGQEGAIHFVQTGYGLFFCSTVFQDALLPMGVDSIELAYDPATRTAQLVDSTEKLCSVSSLAGMMIQEAYLLPADSTPEEIETFFGNHNNGYNQFQYQVMDGQPLQLAIEPVTNPEDYYVIFWYMTTEDEIKCSTPQKLTDYIR